MIELFKLILTMNFMHTVIVYSTPTCHFCHAAKDFFRANNVEFVDYDVAIDELKRNEMLDKSGQMGVPVIDINGEIIIGFDQQRIKQLLGI
jgi:glutaredoxin 3